jgi:hypothetical protein
MRKFSPKRITRNRRFSGASPTRPAATNGVRQRPASPSPGRLLPDPGPLGASVEEARARPSGAPLARKAHRRNRGGPGPEPPWLRIPALA